MVDSATGSRTSDSNGDQLMLADSHTAATTFGLTGSQFLNVPRSKFLYYVKFQRSTAQTATNIGEDWSKTIGMTVKSVDRPRIQFKTETLNQYNRKRIVQTSQEFEPIQFKFHDTIGQQAQMMFVDYYQYYYGNSFAEEAGTSVYDVVTAEGYKIGDWGFKPPLEAQNYGYFFSHIRVYQIHGGNCNSFDLVNPKIRDFNPDDLDSAANGSAEIQMSFEYENIIYNGSQTIPDDLITEMGLNNGKYWDVATPGYDGATYGVGNGDPAGSVGNAIGNVLGQNLASLVTGQGTQSVGGIVSSIAGQFDANRGLAVGKTAVTSLKNLVSGNTGAAKQGAQGLLKGAIFGSPGKFF